MCYCIWCVVLVLLDVVGSGCGALRCMMRALHVETEVNNKHLIVANDARNMLRQKLIINI